MVSRNIFTDLLMIIILIALQIFLFNRLILAGEYIPVIYPLFVMFYPFYRNNYQFLILSFLLGLGIDAFLGTWGINAFATTLIAYFRSLIFRNAIDKDADSFSFQSIQWPQFLFFIFFSIFIHQFFVQILEFFKLSKIFGVFLNIIITSVISFIFILLYALVFKIKEKV